MDQGMTLEEKKDTIMERLNGILGKDKLIYDYCFKNFGPIEYSDGSLYRGEVNNFEEREGRGIREWTNGDRYIGQWEKNQFQGYGKFVYGNGESYEGEWHSGKA
mmetsp:Transcript_18292/g.17414  ORF Transcript_18292/g.17414 Transcript_18292/m.17414 type:complete len:104 (-) Transcript_18292:543-854(-)|eukprot:CAMPEP_0170543320 /NCGR_PEP_ID=MMETSP0211-20121228/2472_1 /TAXON_ID=311385 /ORGANISM="Pseudokeronopsis sp., Strain OXSARD2" /LENGTH=103 /DNA_ID=CAMNT_0010846657 /DNA_START=282 /DNA_END=593 /DNA_ORIENTATION=-